jgi:pyrroloquinoline-quinone synthase
MTDSFAASFAHLHLLQHPFYRAWMEGSLPHCVLQKYAAQYYYHVDRFPRYLSSIHSLCESSVDRQKILENLNEEEGTAFGVSHPQLWLHFAEGLGVAQADVVAELPGEAIQNVVDKFLGFSRASFHEGLGALYAYESQVSEIAESKLEGLKTRYGIQDEKTLAFFEVHRCADIEHRAVILEMLNALPGNEKEQARVAARIAAQALWDFLSEMHDSGVAVA